MTTYSPVLAPARQKAPWHDVPANPRPHVAVTAGSPPPLQADPPVEQAAPAPVEAELLRELLPGDEVIELDAPQVGGCRAYRVTKRGLDLALGLFTLAMLAAPMVVVAALIKIESPGPALYAQQRVGRYGQVFRLYKFRSMRVDAEAGGARWASKNDDRVTRLGRLMRKTRVDEVPQLWNVVKGEMSLVGPRPERPVFCEAFEQRIRGWHYRTCVRPGITGVAQVNGGYDLLPRDKVRLDLDYIRRRGLAVDLMVLARTIGVMVTGRGAQ